jgi:murein DD-endopeptidase MepM/ murein hydrolase activator NlpD
MLDAQQIADLHDIIAKAYLDRDIADEMLDHYATHIESLMIEGLPYERALKLSIQSLPEKTLNEINKAYKKTKLMKNIKTATPIAVALTLFAIVLNIQLLSQEEAWQLPVAQQEITKMSSGFGMRQHPIQKAEKMHTGMDFVAPLGTPVKAVKSGVVKQTIIHNKGYGNYIVILHKDSTETMYAQLNEIKVQPNDTVHGGDIIGTVGSSGTSTGPHLHFEVIEKGKKVNPTSKDPIFKMQN